jgi:CHASE2 domain-containing sensor protein/serine/threonine protein kinase
MEEEHTSTLTKKYDSAANQSSTKRTKATSTVSARRSKMMARLGHLLAATSAVGASLLAAFGSGLGQLMESQAISTFYQLRGVVTPPEDIVILAIDEQTISIPEQYYKLDPKKYAYLEPLIGFPPKRTAYAQVIDKLIEAGARSVALDIILDSSRDETDDRMLRSALERHGSKVTLAALYEEFEAHQGSFMQLTQPHEQFRIGGVSTGSVNFPLEVDGKIHRLGSEYNKSLVQDDGLIDKIPSLDEVVLGTAQVNYPQPKGSRIHFYGPAGTFEQIPLWYVLDPQNWNNYLQKGKFFKDKIVLIGATAQLGKDFFPVPVSENWLYPEQMPGVEIHANAIATLMQGKAIGEALPTRPIRGLFVLALVGGCALAVTRSKRGVIRLFSSFALAMTWGSISYGLFIYSQLIFPTAVPIIAIAAIGLSYLGTEVAREVIRKSQLLDIFQKYSSHRVVQEILSQQDDLKDLLQQREMAISGKILDGRYKIVKVLGAGGFSETYIAEDTKLPGNPLCVVKQLKPATTKKEQLEVARRLFSSEAQTLQKLGTHNQIPQLLAYFEEDEEFYLIQEYILGRPLNQKLQSGRRLPEGAVIQMLRDLLQTLAFVHKNGVIHRDIKPSNIIQRDSDRKLVLIDFGAVKEVATQMLENQEETAYTIGIGTKGYAPSEQCFGRPQYNSDIYAVGMIGIKALTGITPHEIERDYDGELKWLDKADVSQALAQILTKMVRDNFQQRYQSATDVLAELDELVTSFERQSTSQQHSSTNISTSTFRQEEDDLDTPTTPWEGGSESSEFASSTSLLPSPYPTDADLSQGEFK